jgi:hypothetical protein
MPIMQDLHMLFITIFYSPFLAATLDRSTHLIATKPLSSAKYQRSLSAASQVAH